MFPGRRCCHHDNNKDDIKSSIQNFSFNFEELYLITNTIILTFWLQFKKKFKTKMMIGN